MPYPPEVKFAPVRPEAQNVAYVLEQRAAVYAHDRDHAERYERHGHDHDAYGAGHGYPEELRRAHRGEQQHGFNGVSRIHHAAEELA